MTVENTDRISTNLLDFLDSHHSDMKAEKLEEFKLLFRSHVDVVAQTLLLVQILIRRIGYVSIITHLILASLSPFPD